MKTQHTKFIATGLVGAIILMAGLDAGAESLFRASANYNAEAPFTPPSLFTPPTSKAVGDLVTIRVDETSEMTSDAELKITRSQVINQNGSNMFNRTVRFFLDKLPFNTGDIQNTLSTPSYDGLNNQNNLGSKAESTRETEVTDIITCQVVQVLPNGHLVVQGRKTLSINKERQDTIVTGIVNPYYLSRNNEISSKMVANFEMLNGGKGVISRQQNDGVANKIYQFFN